MLWQILFVIVPLLLATLGTFILAVTVARRRRSPGRLALAVMLLATALWTASNLLGLLSPSFELQVFWANWAYFGVLAVPATWFVFTWQYRGGERQLPRSTYVLLAVEPLIMLGLIWTNPAHGLFRAQVEPLQNELLALFEVQFGPAFWLHAAYSYVLLGTGTVLMLREALRHSRIYRAQAVTVFFAALIPWIFNAIYLGGLSPIRELDLTPFGFALTGLLLSLGLHYARLFDLLPVARDYLIEHMPDGLLVFDEQQRIVDVNAALQTILEQPRSALIGRSASDVLAPWPQVIALLDHGGADSIDIERVLNGNRRIFDVRCADLPSRMQRSSGRLLIWRDATEREQMAETIRQSEQRYRTLARNLPGVSVLLFDQELRHVVVEGNTHDRLGLKREDILGVTLDQLVDDTDLAIFEPYYRLALDGETSTIELERRGRHFSWRFVPVRAESREIIAGMALSEDVTARHEAERAIWQANHNLQMRVDELQALYQISRILVSGADLATVLQSVARELTDLFGADTAMIALLDEQHRHFTVQADVDLDPEQPSLLGRIAPLSDVPETYALLNQGQIEVLDRPRINALRTRFAPEMLPDRLSWLLIAPLVMRNELRGVLLIGVERENGRFSEAEMRLTETIAGQIAGAVEQVRQYQAAERAREAAEIASQAKSRFLAAVSHELRTPLNGILGYTQTLRRDPQLLERHRDTVQVIEQSGEHLLALINDLIDLARIEAGRLDLQAEPTDLEPFLEGIAGMARLWAQQRGLDFSFDLNLEPGNGQIPPRAVCIDGRRLRQVLLNLLGNAIKFTDAGMITMQVAALPRSEDHDPNRCLLRFKVADTGVGIAPEDLARIFGLFEQVGDVRRRGSGSGLGLAISSELLQLMGSRLQVESTYGEGSLFWFDLDLEVTAATNNAVTRPVVAAPAPAPAAPAQESRVHYLPAAQLEELQRLARLGDIRAIGRQAASLEQQNGSSADLARQLIPLARSYRIEAIRTLLARVQSLP